MGHRHVGETISVLCGSSNLGLTSRVGRSWRQHVRKPPPLADIFPESRIMSSATADPAMDEKSDITNPEHFLPEHVFRGDVAARGVDVTIKNHKKP